MNETDYNGANALASAKSSPELQLAIQALKDANTAHEALIPEAVAARAAFDAEQLKNRHQTFEQERYEAECLLEEKSRIAEAAAEAAAAGVKNAARDLRAIVDSF